MVFLDVAKESAYLLPGLGPAIGGVNEVVKLYEVWDDPMDVSHD